MTNSGLFGVRNAKPDENPKKQAESEISLNLNYAVRAAGTSHGMSRRKQTSLHVPPIAITCRNDTVRNQRKPHHLSAKTSRAAEMSHLEPLQ